MSKVIFLNRKKRRSISKQSKKQMLDRIKLTKQMTKVSTLNPLLRIESPNHDRSTYSGMSSNGFAQDESKLMSVSQRRNLPEFLSPIQQRKNSGDVSSEHDLISLRRAKDVDEEMDRFEEMALLNLDARKEYLDAQTNLIKLELREQS